MTTHFILSRNDVHHPVHLLNVDICVISEPYFTSVLNLLPSLECLLTYTVLFPLKLHFVDFRLLNLVNRMNEEHFIILGGNGFVGFETVMAITNKYSETEELFATAADYANKRRCCITLLNRGKSWDWNKWDTLSKSSSAYCSVEHIRYNRKESPEECAQLVSLMRSTDKVAAVIDFSAYRPSELSRFVEFIRAKCQLYVLISTDSVYEVCLEKRHSGSVLETDAVRPPLESDRCTYNHRDKYGHQKLCCEEYLHRQSVCPDGIPYVVFRLADVIGPRDCTNRFWQYLLWLKLCLHHEVPFYLCDTDRNKNISICYVKDVAMFLAHCLYNNVLNKQLLQTSDCCCYNMALFESTTLEDMIKLICDQLPSKRQVRIIYSASENVPQLLPSVSCGPISTVKISTVFGWTSTSLLNAVKETVSFYQNIMQTSEFSAEKEECMKELLDDLTNLYSERLVFQSFKKTLKYFLKL